MKLFLCEKPSQGRDIARVLGVQQKKDGYIEGSEIVVTWCLGHLLELAPPESYADDLKPWRISALPVMPKNWRLNVNKKTQKQFRVIQGLLKKANEVVIATDADREGDLIAREVLAFCGYRGATKRLWLSALDTASIKKALNDLRPGDSTVGLGHAGLGRQRADWLIGMNGTMAMTCLFGESGQGALSVGRVQSPTRAMVVERDRFIDGFASHHYHELHACFAHQDESFWSQWVVPESSADDKGRCLKETNAKAAEKKIQGKQGIVESFQEDDKRTPVPLCFSLSSLQKYASSRWGYAAKKTLEIAQSLYEKHKAATYPRTDCGFLPTEQFKDAPDILKLLKQVNAEWRSAVEGADARFQSRTWNDNNITAHHGIIPTTNPHLKFSSMSEEEKNIYGAVVLRYIAQFWGDYHYRLRKAVVLCEQERFAATQHIPQKLGWKKVLADDKDDSGDNKTTIPALNVESSVAMQESRIDTKKTKPPARYTEGTLIAAMKNIAKLVTDSAHKSILKSTLGIGTEATRADIIEKLIHKGYIVRQKKQLISTAKGQALVDVLPEMLKNPATTAQWEQALDEIARGKGQLKDFLLDQEDILLMLIADMETMRQQKPVRIHQDGLSSCEDDVTCPLCQKSRLVRRQSKKTKRHFWGCAGYPDCQGTYFDNDGQPNLATPQRRKAV